MKMSELFKELSQSGVRFLHKNNKVDLKLPKDLDKNLKSKLIKNKIEFKYFLDNIYGISKINKRPLWNSQKSVLCSFSQQRLWFIDQLQGGSSEYNIPAALEVVGNFNLDVAEQAISDIIKRHEILRTVYLECNGEVLQKVNSSFEFKLNREDLSGYSSIEQEDKVAKLIELNRSFAFDLQNDLMIKAS